MNPLSNPIEYFFIAKLCFLTLKKYKIIFIYLIHDEMKKYEPKISAFCFVKLWQKKNINLHIMRGTDGLYIERFPNEPITGAIYGDYGKEGKFNKVYLGEIVNGKREGNWTSLLA